MLKRVQIPDVLPGDLLLGSNFSLIAGDFEDIYGQQGGEADPDEPSPGPLAWDAVLTCFFIYLLSFLYCGTNLTHATALPWRAGCSFRRRRRRHGEQRRRRQTKAVYQQCEETDTGSRGVVPSICVQ